jgi:hypothetical protein
MTIKTLAKTVSVLALASLLIAFYVLRQKPVLPRLQQPEPASESGPSSISADPWIAVASAVRECKARRLGGELKTYMQSATCSNPGILQAFTSTNFQRMDLIQQFIAKRLEFADKLDRGQITEAQSNQELSELANLIRNDRVDSHSEQSRGR